MWLSSSIRISYINTGLLCSFCSLQSINRNRWVSSISFKIGIIPAWFYTNTRNMWMVFHRDWYRWWNRSFSPMLISNRINCIYYLKIKSTWTTILKVTIMCLHWEWIYPRLNFYTFSFNDIGFSRISVSIYLSFNSSKFYSRWKLIWFYISIIFIQDYFS